MNTIRDKGSLSYVEILQKVQKNPALSGLYENVKKKSGELILIHQKL